MGNRLYIELNKVESYYLEAGKLVLSDTNWELQFFDDFETHSVPVPQDFFEKIPLMSESEFHEYLITCLLEISCEFSQILQMHKEKGVCVCGYFLDATEIPSVSKQTLQCD